jgi:hypothetical protein
MTKAIRAPLVTFCLEKPEKSSFHEARLPAGFFSLVFISGLKFTTCDESAINNIAPQAHLI